MRKAVNNSYSMYDLAPIDAEYAKAVVRARLALYTASSQEEIDAAYEKFKLTVSVEKPAERSTKRKARGI